MRINIEVDEGLMRQAMLASGAETQREAIERGLALLVELHAQAQVRALKGKITWDDTPEVPRPDR